MSEHVNNKAIALIKLLHGCKIGATEFNCGYGNGERVDAILFNSWGSFIIETKISIQDFKADANKPFRKDPSEGIGRYRFFACPEGLIKPEDLPDRWGLIWVKSQKNRRATMPVGYGGSIQSGSYEHPEYGWSVPKYKTFGSEGKYKTPDDPRSKFEFKDRNMQQEWSCLFSLANRYKANEFMDNIL